jgi:hypothetical protein
MAQKIELNSSLYVDVTASHKLTYLFHHQDTKWMPHHLPLLTHVHMEFQEYSKVSKSLTLIRCCGVQKP